MKTLRLFLFLTVALMLGVVSACSSNGTDSSDTGNNNAADNTTDSTENATNDTSKPNVLNVAMEGKANTLDHQASTGGVDRRISRYMNCFLFDYDQDMNMKSSLATWDQVNDKKIKLKIRQDAYFHNGRQVEGSDVKFSINRIKDPKTGSPSRSDMASIKSIEVPSKFEVILNLKHPFSPLRSKLTKVAIVPKEAADHLDSEPVGCGPFKFDEWKRGQSVTMTKFDKYWKKDAPKLDKLEFDILPEQASARSAFLAKDIDVWMWANNADVKSIDSKDGMHTVNQNLLGMYRVGFNFAEKGPWNNSKVREAIKYAVDRQAMVDSAFGGYGSPAYSYVPKKSYYYNTDWEYQQDISKAKKLMKEAGYPDGFKVKLTVPDTSVEGPLGVILQAQLKKIGIQAKVNKLEVSSYLDKVFEKENFEMTVVGSTGNGDPDYPTYNYLVTGAPNDHISWHNKKFDQLMNKGRSVYDKEKRKQYYDQAFKLVHEQNPWILLVQEKRFSAVQDYVKGYVFKPNLTYEFKNVTINK